MNLLFLVSRARWIFRVTFSMTTARTSTHIPSGRHEYNYSRSIGWFTVVKEARFYGQETRTTCNSPVGVGEPSLCCDLSQVCRGARFGDPVHADVANGPRIGISAGISARVRSLRDVDSGSAPDPEDSQIWSAIDGCVDDCRTSQPHFRVGIWFVLCRCSHGDAAGCYLSPGDAQASSHSRRRETALKLIVIR